MADRLNVPGTTRLVSVQAQRCEWTCSWRITLGKWPLAKRTPHKFDCIHTNTTNKQRNTKQHITIMLFTASQNYINVNPQDGTLVPFPDYFHYDEADDYSLYDHSHSYDDHSLSSVEDSLEDSTEIFSLPSYDIADESVGDYDEETSLVGSDEESSLDGLSWEQLAYLFAKSCCDQNDEPQPSYENPQETESWEVLADRYMRLALASDEEYDGNDSDSEYLRD